MAQSKRVQEVRQVVAQFLGCHEKDLRAANSKILVCDKYSLQGVMRGLTSGAMLPTTSRSLLASAVKAANPFSGNALDQLFDGLQAAKQEQDRALEKILNDAPDGGVILRQKGSTRWQMILPDVGEPGRWRSQSFDDRGFSGHSVFDTQKQALHDAWQQGYKDRDDEALDRIQELPSFVRGNYLSELVRKVNLGQLTMQGADAALLEYDQAQLLKSELANALTQALYEPVSDTIVLVADQIQPGEETAVLLHELVHKHGPWTLGRGFGRLVDQVIAWRERDADSVERKIFDVAHERAIFASSRAAGVDTAKSLYVYRQEILAHAVEAAVAMGVTPAHSSERAPGRANDDAEAWLADVVDTFRGLRAQLLNAPTEPVSLQQVVDMAYALAQLETPSRAAQVVARLQAGAQSDPELTAWVKDIVARVEDFAARKQLASEVMGNPVLINGDDLDAVARMPKGAEPSLVAAISSVYRDEEFWRVMVDESVVHAGPFDGGCLVVARAILRAAGRGELVRIASNVNGAEHYGAEIDGVIYDFYGAHASGNAWVQCFYEKESLEQLHRTWRFERGYVPGGIVDDAITEARIAKMLTAAGDAARKLQEKGVATSRAPVDHAFLHADIGRVDTGFDELVELLDLQARSLGGYPWAAMVKFEDLSDEARLLIERKMNADIEGREFLTLKPVRTTTGQPIMIHVQAVAAPVGCYHDPRVVHLTAAAEAFWGECALDVIPDDEIAIWNQLADEESSDQVLLDGWVLEGDRAQGRYDLEREFYVRDPQGVDLGFWRCVKVEVIDHSIVSAKIVDHEGCEIITSEIIAARTRMLAPRS